MADSCFHSIWQIINAHKLKVVGDSINEDFRCVICKKLFYDACSSSICGCKYCVNCVTGYKSRYCPGKKEFCKVNPMKFEINVARNEDLNKNIYQLKFNCPNQGCKSNIELIAMEKHLRLCTMKSIDCLNVVSENTDEIVTHINNETLTYSQSLIESVQNLLKEVTILKEDSEESKSKIATLRNESRIIKNDILELEEDLQKAKEKFELRLTDEREKRKTEITELRGHIRDARKTETTYLWLIDQFSQEGVPIFSPPFSVNNYQCRLSLDRCGTYFDDVLLTCHIMMGNYDDQLEWPMQRSVMIYILDQYTKLSYASVTGDIEFSEPTTNHCDSITGHILNYSSIINNASIIVDDSILVRCVITDP